MALPVPPINPNTPIQNNPFYYPETNYIKGEYGPFVVGSGFSINNITGTIQVSGGGSGAPTILAGLGIAVTSGTGTVTITNTGIRTVTAGAGISVSVVNGNLSITNTAPSPGAFGTVTSVGTGVGLTGGPITNFGTISLAPVSTVAPGVYPNATITVDAYGRVTAASPGTGGLGSLLQANAPLSVNASFPQTISINNASTAAPGAVQLNTSTNSTSTTQAATPSAVKAAYDIAASASVNAANALSTAATASSTAGTALTTANNAEATAIAAQAAATAAAALAGNAIPCSAFTFPGQILAATGSGTFCAVPLGTNGQVLTVCGACPAGMTWATSPVSSAGIPCACITAKGALITGTAPGVVNTLPVGTNGFVLTADSTCINGLKWAAAASPTVSATPTVEGVVYGYTNNGTNFGTALGHNALNTTVTGSGNVAIGTLAGRSLASGQNNTFVGAGAGCANIAGSNNIALGAQSLFAVGAGNGNIAIGNLSGLNLTTECNNVLLGPYVGQSGCNNNIYLASGDGTLRMRINQCGAFAFNGTSYGASGQILTSAGPNGAPTWGTAPVTAVTGTSPISVTAGLTPVVSIASASTTAPGAVQLYNGTNSSSTTLALTAAQGCSLQTQINSLLTAPSIDLAGTLDASSGFVISVTSVGSSKGYTIGANLPAATSTTNNTYVIVTTPGTFTPPGGSATAATRGDWFLVSQTSPGVYSWQFLNVGFDAPAATTSTAGIVCLSTDALAQAGVDTTTALTPAAAASAYIPKACVTGKGALITGSAANTPVALSAGTDGQVLVACSTAANGLCWVTAPVALDATPTVSGKVLGRTDSTNAALGCNAFLTGGGVNNVAIGLDSQKSSTASDNISLGAATLKANTAGFQNTAVGHIAMCSLTGANANQNVALGSSALCGMTSGLSNDAIGALAMLNFTAGCYNVAVGGYSLYNYTSGNFNTAIGHRALTNATTGCCNTALGIYAGENITTGCGNVVIGPNVQVANASGNNQLAIGYNSANNWLTGDSNKNIRPGAGIRDCAGSLGTSGQVLTTTGSAVQWASKQFMSASIRSNQALNANSTVTGWQVDNSSGIILFFSSFTLTVGKNYLITTSLTVNSGTYQTVSFQWYNNSGPIGPTIFGRTAQNFSPTAPGALSSSFIYTPTAGNEAINLRIGAFPNTLADQGNSLTIVEL